MTYATPTSELNPVIYAVGDVHGEAKRLQRLHALIAERHDLLYQGRPKQLIHLGDYVDRGGDSAGVIDTLIAMQSEMGDNCVCLRGNHEAMMLEGVSQSTATVYQNWLINGGKETMASYATRGEPAVPDAHVDWLSGLPSICVKERAKTIFVHAGINPCDYPNEREDIYLWTRARRFFDVESWQNPALDGWTVVHGHTPTDDFFPEISKAKATRINLDTGAVFGGRLTAGILDPGQPVQFIYA